MTCVCVGAVIYRTAAPLTGSSSVGATQPTFRLLCLQQAQAHSSEETKAAFTLGSHNDAMLNYSGNVIVQDGLD